MLTALGEFPSCVWKWFPRLVSSSKRLRWGWLSCSSLGPPCCPFWRLKWHLLSSSLWVFLQLGTIKDYREWPLNDICQLTQPLHLIGPTDLWMSSLLIYFLTWPSTTSSSSSLSWPFSLASRTSDSGLASRDWGKEGIQYPVLSTVPSNQV